MKTLSTKFGLSRTTRKAVLRTSWGRLGNVLGSWGRLWGCFGCVLGGTWALLGGLQCVLGVSCSVLGPLGACLGRVLEKITKTCEGTNKNDPSWRPNMEAKTFKIRCKISICFQRHFPTQFSKIFNGFLDQKINVFCNLSIRMQKYRFWKKIAFSHGKIAKVKGSKGFNLIKNLQKDDQKNTKKHEDFQ